MVSDNLRKGAALNTVQILETLLERKLVERKDIDAIDICTPNDLHADYALRINDSQRVLLIADEVATGPSSATALVIREPVECSPCLLKECPIDHRCMTGISPDAVFEAAALALMDPAEEIYETTGSVS